MRPFQYISLVFTIAIIAVVLLHITLAISLLWLALVVLAYLIIVVYGVSNVRANFFIKSHNRLSNTKQIALTFDDGPVANTNAILDILNEQGVRATFFCIGNHVKASPEIISRIDKEGHLIGNHSYYHTASFDWQSSKSMLNELDQTNKVISKLIDKTPKLFRPPYGVTNPNLAKAIRHSGLISIGWSVRSFDTVIKDEDKLIERILERIKGGDIILLHDTMSITHKILTNLIVKAREKGVTFVSLDEALGLNAYEENN